MRQRLEQPTCPRRAPAGLARSAISCSTSFLSRSSWAGIVHAAGLSIAVAGLSPPGRRHAGSGGTGGCGELAGRGAARHALGLQHRKVVADIVGRGILEPASVLLKVIAIGLEIAAVGRRSCSGRRHARQPSFRGSARPAGLAPAISALPQLLGGKRLHDLGLLRRKIRQQPSAPVDDAADQSR